MEKQLQRRWLLVGTHPDVRPLPTATDRFVQGYVELPDRSEHLRVRIINDGIGILTLKRGQGVARHKIDDRISLPMALALMERAAHRFQKHREYVDGFCHDVFGPPLTGIQILERQMLDESEHVVLPGWAADAVEVTGTLTNLHLARLATQLRGSEEDPLPILLERARALPIRRVALFGGPGSGKSGAIAAIRPDYPEVHFVPETATIVIGQLGMLPGNDHLSHRRFQQTIWQVQKLFEATSVEYAAATGKRAVLLDRGVMDNAAYLPGGVSELMELFGTTAKAEYANYDLVIGLDVPPPEVYERVRGNNTARSESYQEAVAIGELLEHAWSGHPRHAYISNDDGWDGKLAGVRRELDALLGR